ncbi:MAG: type II secretion system protein [Elusimicrobia bacterium]|nr:type II secretion system protein [Elusimicrobiota bacterium]
MRIQKRGERSGFTIVETVVTAAILSLLALVIAPLLVHSTRFFLLNRTRVDLQRDARVCMAIITKNLRQANSSTITISQIAGQPYYSQISFSDVNGVNFAYAQNGTLLREARGAQTKTLLDDLRFLNFYFPRSDDMTIVSVSMTLEKAIYEGRTKALHVATERVRVMN